MDDLETAIRYHELTKHHFDRFAPSRGYMDWANQPDPFRRYADAPLLPLPIREDGGDVSYDAVYDACSLSPHPLDLAGISELLYRSMAISAWKEFQGTRWALRCNPSSGNLHPTETYLCCPAAGGLSDRPGIYHYAVKEHGLEQRLALEDASWRRLARDLPENGFLVGFSSIHWREAWKYGERAYRYCQHDLGHALAAMCLAAGSLGWRARVLGRMGDQEISDLLGLERGPGEAEAEHPDLLLLVHPADFRGELPARLPPEVSREVSRGSWLGTPSRLSPGTVPWEGIAAVETACRKEAEAAGVREAPRAQVGGTQAARGGSARSLFRRRRSAVAFDGRTGVSLETFGRMLGRLLPDPARPPWDAWPHQPALHLVLFVHRVDGLTPGLYCLPRPGSESGETGTLRAAMREDFLWEKPEGIAADLPLFLLLPMDCRGLAQRLSCDQAIAGMSAFSLGMIAEFEPRLRQAGAWFYRRLFWEAGMIGQVLYLEAEAAGVRATGIGCYYDDPVHELLGLEGRAFQSLYHFTVGGAVEDGRLITLPAYGASEEGSVQHG